MQNEINELTKLICSVVHYDYKIRNLLLALLSDNQEQPLLKENDIDTIEILKHCLYSKQTQSKLTVFTIIEWFFNKYFITIFPLTVFIVFVYISSIDNYSLEIYIAILCIIFITCCIVVIVSVFNIKSKIVLGRTFFEGSKSIHINLSDKNKDLLERKKELLLEKIIIYKDFNPFEGVGVEAVRWSFTTSLTKENEKLSQDTNLDFDEAELLEFIEENLKRINFICSDVFLISESSVKQNDIKEKNVEEYLLNSESLKNEFNFYKKFEIFNFYDFEGITGYITINKDEHLLYIEVNIYYLPTILNSLNESINLLLKEELNFRDYLNVTYKSMKARSHKNVQFYNTDKNNYSTRIKGILGNLALNERLRTIRINQPLRGIYSTFENLMIKNSIDIFFDNHLQYTRYNILAQKLEKTLLYSIEVFLKERGIDTTEFSNRKTTILNQGVFVKDGNLSVDNLAVGKNAKVSNKRMVKNER